MNFQDIVASASPEVYTNENFETIDYASVYGKRQPVTSGLTWGYYGGRWNGIVITAGTISLTNNIENYISVNRSTGAIGKEATTGSPSVAPTNWNNLRDYARVYKLWVSGGVVTAVEDHRAGNGGIFGPAGFTATRVPFAASDGSLTDDSGFTFNTTGDILTAGAINVAGTTPPTVGWYNPSGTTLRTPNSITVDGVVAAGSQIYTTGANTAHGASRLLMEQESAAVSVLTAYGTNGSTNGSLVIRSRRSDGSNSISHTIGETGVSFTGTLSATAHVTAGTTLAVNGNGIIQDSTNAEASVSINYTGYANGTTQFRNLQIYDGKNGLIGGFYASGKTLATQGLLDLSAAGAGQIKFPATQNASADANTLDDYEEGTWTAAFTAGTSGTITINGATGRYIKVGSKVTIAGLFDVASVSSPIGILNLTGLPFTSSNSYYTGVAVHAEQMEATATTAIQGFIATASTAIRLTKFAAGVASALAADVKATTTFIVNATYPV